jgi:hypothetical protein
MNLLPKHLQIRCEHYHTSVCHVEDAVEINCTACHKKVWRAKLLVDLTFTGTKDRQKCFGKAGTFINITTMNGLYGVDVMDNYGASDFLPIDKKDFEFIELEPKPNLIEEKLKNNKLRFISKLTV